MENATSSIPGLPPLIQTLLISPCGVETYTDLARQKTFTVLHFRHKGGSQTDVLVWTGDVLDMLAAAKLPASGSVDIILTPDVARSTSARVKYRCHLKVPVELKEPKG